MGWTAPGRSLTAAPALHSELSKDSPHPSSPCPPSVSAGQERPLSGAARVLEGLRWGGGGRRGPVLRGATQEKHETAWWWTKENLSPP